jgi:hypothetical protein
VAGSVVGPTRASASLSHPQSAPPPGHAACPRRRATRCVSAAGPCRRHAACRAGADPAPPPPLRSGTRAQKRAAGFGGSGGSRAASSQVGGGELPPSRARHAALLPLAWPCPPGRAAPDTLRVRRRPTRSVSAAEPDTLRVDATGRVR